jgi:hypothetical protein
VAAVGLGAALPLGASLAHGVATGWDDYWFAVAGYRLSAPSGAAGDLGARWDRLSGTLPKALLDLWPVLLCSPLGLARGRHPGGTALGLVAPVWLAAGAGRGRARRAVLPALLRPARAAPRPARRARGHVPRQACPAGGARGALIVPGAAQVGYLQTLSDDRLDRWVMDDERLLANRSLAPWLEARTLPEERIYAFVTSADLYFLTDRRSPYPYLWLYNVLEIPGARERLRRTLESSDGPSFVVLYQRPDEVDTTGGLARALATHYREVTRIEGIPILQRTVEPAAA